MRGVKLESDMDCVASVMPAAMSAMMILRERTMASCARVVFQGEQPRGGGDDRETNG